MKVAPRKATPKQIEYLAILFDDLGFKSGEKRIFINDLYGINFTDELTLNQASELIANLLQRKNGE